MMNAFSQHENNKDKAVADSLTTKPSEHGSGLHLQDNRPQSAIQRKQVEALQRGPVVQRKNNTGLSDQLKSGVESLSGQSMDDVKVHYNSDKPAQLNAHAYAQGTDIHIASGQEKHLPHEAWHVVQQKQGRVKPTMQMKGKVNVNDDKGLEKEADRMGSNALTMGDRIAKTATAAGGENSMQGGHFKQHAGNNISVGMPAQLKNLKPQDAADEADNVRKANPHDRGAMTNNWISDADEGATTNAWAAKAAQGYVHNSSVSLTGGGAGRPPSIDLKAKPTGAAEAEFIFHLPKFANVQAIIAYLMSESGIPVKHNRIADLGRINLNAPISDHDITRIRDTPPIDISLVTNNPIYQANSADILRFDQNFLTTLQGGINASNQALGNIQNDGRFLQAEQSKNTRLKKVDCINKLNLIKGRLPEDRKILNLDDFGAIENNIRILIGKCTPIWAAFSLTEKREINNLIDRCKKFKEIKKKHADLFRRISAACLEANEKSYTAGMHRQEVLKFEALRDEEEVGKPYWTHSEFVEINSKMVEYVNILNAKKPKDVEKRKAPDNDKDKDEDEEEEEGKKKEEDVGNKKANTSTITPVIVNNNI
jgi:hypothetical protein